MATLSIYRVEIEGSDGRGWYTLIEADSAKDARARAKKVALLLGDKITRVDGPFIIHSSRARFMSGFHAREET